MVIHCGNCGRAFEPRRQGRRQQYCPGGKCRKAAQRERWRLGGKALARAGRKKSEPKAPKPRSIERNESWGFQKVRRDLSRFGPDGNLLPAA